MSTTSLTQRNEIGGNWQVPTWIGNLSASKKHQIWVSAQERDWMPQLSRIWQAERGNPAGWGWHDEAIGPEAQRLWDPKSTLDVWEPSNGIAAALDDHDQRAAAVVCLSVAYALPRLARETDEDCWWSLIEQLVQLDETALFSAASLLPRECLMAELSAVFATLFRPAKRIAKQCLRDASRRLSAMAEEFLDGTGLPHAQVFDQIRPWLAAWTRCHDFVDRFGPGWPNDEGQEQYGWMVRRALQLTRGDGTSALSDSAPWEPALLALSLELDDDPVDCLIAERMQLLRVLPKPQRQSLREKVVVEPTLPEPSDDSEWAQAAIFRSGWKPTSALAAITYENASYCAELGARRFQLLTGAIQTQVTINGEPVGATNEWSQTCWFSDRSSDYLELELALPEGWRWQRQFLFERKAKIILIADAILGTHPGRIEVDSTWQLGERVEWEAEAETEDGWLVCDGERQAWLAPLWSPEWRDQGRPRAINVSAGSLAWHAQGSGTAVYAPLFIDLHARRSKQPLRTWRQLTVAEQLRIVDPDEAVGYRIQVGRKKQWLIYRSLSEAKSRTVLGQNLNTEFFAGRFYRTGEAVPYVEVEAE